MPFVRLCLCDNTGTGGHLCHNNCSANILLAIALALQLFLSGCADACTASISAILSTIAQAQFKYSRLEMIAFQSNGIKVLKKTFTRHSQDFFQQRTVVGPHLSEV